MPRTPNAEALFHIGKNVHEICLKKEGFKKRQNSWNREIGGFVQVITFWSGPYERFGAEDSQFWGLDHYGEFRINVGLYIPEVNRLWEHGYAPSFVTEPYCQIRTTIGDLMGHKNDFWLPIHTDFTETVVYLGILLRNHVLPFFEQFSTREKVKTFLNGQTANSYVCNPRINFAIMLYHEGDKEAAQQLLQAHHDASDHPGHEEYVRERATALGLTVVERQHLKNQHENQHT